MAKTQQAETLTPEARESYLKYVTPKDATPEQVKQTQEYWTDERILAAEAMGL